MKGPGLNGILVIDKPVSVTSAKAVAIVKNKLKVSKVGHTGTLDPLAEGVLICCVNKATKIARFLLKDRKEYEAILKLGITTDTQDSTGSVKEVRDTSNISAGEIQAALKQFEGRISQQPPVFSALKHRGVPLYRLARRGIPVQKPARLVTIHSIAVMKISMPYIQLRIACGAGTYIRTLCADLGKYLGCGGHLYALKRTQSGGFRIQQAVPLEKIQNLAAVEEISDYLIEMNDALQDMPAHRVDPAIALKIGHGVLLRADELMAGTRLQDASHLKILDPDNNLLAVLEYRKDEPFLKYCCVLNA